jgi:hypothetical protein
MAREASGSRASSPQTPPRVREPDVVAQTERPDRERPVAVLPSVAMTTLYEVSEPPVFSPETPVSLNDYAGKALLIYNAAAL